MSAHWKEVTSIDMLLALLLLVHSLSIRVRVHACTTFAAGRLATADGSVIVSQSDDGDGAVDARLVIIPRQEHNVSSTRQIFPNSAQGYPRFVGSRASTYKPTKADPIPTASTGEIPQTLTTYAYYEGDYGLLNELGVSIGETSCSARILAPEKGPLLPIEELSRIALERTNSSRDAVLLMGSLAEKYGFYGVLRGPHSLEEVPNEGGESLMVGDPSEAWVFHILSDGTASGAIWCARRVPDKEVAIVANMFTIREVDLTDTEGRHFLWSESMTRVAKEYGWWSEGQPFDFTKIYSYGEYYSRGYSSRRMWRAFSILNPELHLQSELTEPLFEKAIYPFSVTPKKLVDPQTIMALHRDYYQNTSYDMSKGIAAGPWGLPVRFNPEQAYNGNVKGNWERPMGSFRTGYTAVVQSRNYGVGSVLHFAPHASLGSTFVPLFQNALRAVHGSSASSKMVGLDVADPRGVVKSSHSSLKRRRASLYAKRMQRAERTQNISAISAEHLTVDRRSLYWACRYALNIAYARFQDMHTEIAARQEEWENEAAETIRDLDASVVAGNPVNSSQMHAISAKHVHDVLQDWWDLSDALILDWSDGFYREAMAGDVSTEYPLWWLTAVGYGNGPPNPTPNLP